MTNQRRDHVTSVHTFLSIYSDTGSSFFVLIALQEGSKAARCRFSWRWKAARGNGGTAGGAAVVDCTTVGRAVEVNCGATGRQ